MSVNVLVKSFRSANFGLFEVSSTRIFCNRTYCFVSLFNKKITNVINIDESLTSRTTSDTGNSDFFYSISFCTVSKFIIFSR